MNGLVAVIFPPACVPYLKQRCAKHLTGIASPKAHIPFSQSYEATAQTLVGLPHHALIVMSEVTGLHHLVQQKATLLFVRLGQHILLRQPKHLLHHVHHGLHKAPHPQVLQYIYRRFPFLLRTALSQHVIIVHQLPQADTLAKQMAVDMHQNIYPVEGRRRHGYPSRSFRQLHLVRKLRLGHSLKKALQPVVRAEVIHPRRRKMHFQLRLVRQEEFRMMIEHATPLSVAEQILQNPFATTLHPNVNVATRPAQRIRIEQRHALPLQYGGSETMFPESGIHFGCGYVQLQISAPDLQRHPIPLHQQGLGRLLRFRQGRHYVKQHSGQSLFLGLLINSAPFLLSQSARQLRPRMPRHFQQFKKSVCLHLTFPKFRCVFS